MIDELPRHLNWQTSFLEAFSAHFRRLLDVEKWWELACVNFTDADYASRLSPADSWLLLQQALDVPVQVHFSANNLPAPAQIPLQEVINTWQPAQAGEALQRVADKLARLRPRITPDLQPLLDRYVAAVRSFLNDSRTGQRPGLARNPVSQLAFARTAACQDLNALDAQRAVLRSRYVVAPGQPRLSAAVPADKQ
jgi:hypothetical protein